jgi:hypothetical protein
MTDNELKELVASISVGIRELTESQKKTDRQIQATDRQLQETDRQLQETDQQLQELAESREKSQEETDRQLQETARRLDSIGKMVGGISNNQGDVAEEFFIRGFRQTMALGGLHFDRLLKNYSIGHKYLNDEFDIVLVNGDIVVVIEVKYKVHPGDIKKMLEKKLPNFRSLASTYNNHKLYGAIAGFSIPDDVIEEADRAGLFVLGRSGTNMTLLANHPTPQQV